MRMYVASVMIFLSCLPVLSVGVQDSSRTKFKVDKSVGTIKVDGKLDDPVWEKATRIPLPYETFPGNNLEATYKTTCLLAYDDEHLFFAFIAQDPEVDKIRGYFTDRDDVQQHDRVTIVIDPFNDGRRGFDFTVSALGVQSDGIFDQQTNNTDNSWDAIWNSAGTITGEGYVVEASIPFKSLRFPNTTSVQTWGFYAMRKIPRNNEIEIRSMIVDRDNSCQLCQANLVTGFQGIKPGVNLQATPTLTATKSDNREDFPDGNLQNGNLRLDPGLDLRWNLTTDLTLNGTINPDFSQVESDVAQLNVNNRFALFFPERRPFFLEGADFYNTPLNTVFTRTIADPVWGGKLTGKVGKNALGLIIAKDRVNNLLIPGNQGSETEIVDQKLSVLLGRFRRDVGKNSNIGLMLTNRQGKGYYNTVQGADAFVRISKSITSRFQYLHSNSRYQDSIAVNFDQPSGSFDGNTGFAQIMLQSQKWAGRLQYRVFDNNFRADAGFINQVNVSNPSGWIERRFWGREDHWFTRLNFTAGFWDNRTFSGRLNDQGLWFAIFYQGPMQTFINLNPNLHREYFDGKIFDLETYWSRFQFQPTGNLQFRVITFFGRTIDFDNSRSARRFNIAPNVTLRLGRHIDLRISHTYRRLKTSQFNILTANLSQVRAVYNINTRTFIRAILQLNEVRRNPIAYSDEIDTRTRSLFTQFLFSYKVNPQTVFFLGYSDNNRGMTTESNIHTPLKLENRTFFMKLSYAWRP